MDLSIVIVNYNTTNLTLECVRSIKTNKPKVSYEIIVVDNASTDRLVGKLERTKNIKLIKSKRNLGFAAGNNLGIKKAKGKFILLLNSDVVVKPGSIDSLVTFAKKTKNAGAVAPQLLNKDGSIQASVFKFPTIGRNIRQWWLGQKGLLDKYYPKSKKPTKVDIAVMSAFLITPESLKRVGLMNEKYFMFYEDFDYCRRIHQKSLSVYYLPSAQVYHLHGASGKNLARKDKQWYRLLGGSKIYHGLFGHYIIYFIQRSSDVFKRRVLHK